jgi:hypothetical protein
MITTRSPLAFLLTMILVIQVTTARAGFVTYTDKAAFLGAVSGPVTDDFNDLPTGSAIPTQNRTVGTYQYTAAATGGLYTAGSTGDIWLSTSTATDSIDFAMTAGTPTAMGGFFFDVDVNGQLISGTINVSINGGQFLQTVSTNSATNFFGWVSDDGTPIASFQVAATQPGSGFAWPAVNDLVFAQSNASTPVPEIDPAGMGSVLALLGGGLGLLERRRKRA